MIFDNRYKVIRDIGAGGMGIVFKVQDEFTNEIFALKKLPDVVTVSNPHERFKREIASMASLNHKNIVSIKDYKFEKDNYYIVQEFINGSDLSRILKQRGSIQPIEAVDYLIQIAKALAYMNSKGILHKDLKPGNILINSSGLIKVCDFGLSQSFVIEKPLTNESKFIGSRFYTSPERLTKQKHTVKSEIFSFGIIAFEMLNGTPPFTSEKTIESEKEIEIQNQIRFKEIPSLRERRIKGVTQALENVIIKCTAKRPIERYENFTEIIKDLKTVFNTNREDEIKLKVAQKYRHGMEFSPSLLDEKTSFALPKHVIIFIVMFLTLLIGVFIYAN